jgi:(2R)-sulfolactate sulfo-lyase subunit alpha
MIATLCHSEDGALLSKEPASVLAMKSRSLAELGMTHICEEEMIHCVLHDPDDTVAVIVVEGIKAGATLTGLILDEDRTITLVSRQDIPIGHKVAMKDMAVGDTVIKYGVDIGKVVAPIKKGEHAHVHNIKTKRW